MTAVRRYEASMYDSNRWDGFELRPGDIIISTPPKCGTTWTQKVCRFRRHRVSINQSAQLEHIHPGSQADAPILTLAP